MLKDYGDFLEKDKNEIADNLNTFGYPTGLENEILYSVDDNSFFSTERLLRMATGKCGNPKVFTALLFYLLAGPIFKTYEVKQHSNFCPHDLNDLAHLLGKNTHHLNLNFNTP
ncbi:hypothetical protein [Helicobacter heilmannii]|uniref:hypothetical protein n=1 Tax=Helicobacter heilmannii TaxID=35817 RepID=UPI000CF06E5A|nr:hypothetical protein [Helicobacter heilmannii]GMB94454.1 hypothetical protein NHP21011_05460 [Helicobacter heilmannii]